MAKQGGYGSRNSSGGSARRYVREQTHKNPANEPRKEGNIVKVAKFMDWITVGALLIGSGVFFALNELGWSGVCLAAGLVWALFAWIQPGLKLRDKVVGHRRR